MKKLLLISFLLISTLTFSQPNWERINYCSSTIFSARIESNVCVVDTNDYVGVFVNGECRMKSHLIAYNDSCYVSAVIHSAGFIEYGNVKYWDAESNTYYDFDTVLTIVNHGAMTGLKLSLLKNDNTNIMLLDNSTIKSIDVYNILGIHILTTYSTQDVKNMIPGTYVIDITFTNNKKLKKKVII